MLLLNMVDIFTSSTAVAVAAAVIATKILMWNETPSALVQRWCGADHTIRSVSKKLILQQQWLIPND